MSNPTPEDRRAAAAMQASISSFVLNAALTVIAAEAALIVLFLDKRTILPYGDFALIGAPILVIASFIAGGTGLNSLSVNGWKGDWTLTVVSSAFNLQAIFTLAAALLLMSSVVGTKANSDEAVNLKTMGLQNELQGDEQQINRLESLLLERTMQEHAASTHK